MNQTIPRRSNLFRSGQSGLFSLSIYIISDEVKRKRKKRKMKKRKGEVSED